MLFKPEECENANFVFSYGRKHCQNQWNFSRTMALRTSDNHACDFLSRAVSSLKHSCVFKFIRRGMDGNMHFMPLKSDNGVF